ncbi:alpha/beta hydrolase [Ramlibacter sp.]|uniref:alpha/beta hydrolase n=1 Tax=Ramlibacter sp. TaxID=1917967 RepID=UPI001D0FF7DD|nr:alpha/beta hydrolase [Ramlibacter sp.]
MLPWRAGRGLVLALAALAEGPFALAQAAPPQVVDVPSRPGVSVRVLAQQPAQPRAVVLLLPGGDGAPRIADDGSVGRMANNFVIRTRALYLAQGIATVVVDAPSDHGRPPYLAGWRHSPEHVADLAAVLRWAGQWAHAPAWLVGTSRGTESAAEAALRLQGMPGLAGLVLTSTILDDPRTTAVPELPLDTLRLPVLAVHHARDTCRVSAYADLPRLIVRLPTGVPGQVRVVQGGTSTGDACRAMAWHGFNGAEPEVVREIAAWILAH